MKMLQLTIYGKFFHITLNDIFKFGIKNVYFSF